MFDINNRIENGAIAQVAADGERWIHVAMRVAGDAIETLQDGHGRVLGALAEEGMQRRNTIRESY